MYLRKRENKEKRSGQREKKGFRISPSG